MKTDNTNTGTQNCESITYWRIHYPPYPKKELPVYWEIMTIIILSIIVGFAVMGIQCFLNQLF
jgi:hypothetical protein